MAMGASLLRTDTLNVCGEEKVDEALGMVLYMAVTNTK